MRLSAESGALDRLHDAERALESMSAVHPGSQALLDRLRSTRIELDDLAREAEMQGEGLDLDPPRWPRPKPIGTASNGLLDKHRADTSMRSNAASPRWRNGSPPRKTATDSWPIGTQALPDSRQTLDDIGATLDAHRDKPLGAPCVALGEHLAHLKMAAPGSHFEWSPPELPKPQVPPCPTLMFTANAGLAPQPMGKVASGGERSRVMLALKAALSEHLEVPTLILDEIDAGVSGDVAARMADLMAGIANRPRSSPSPTSHRWPDGRTTTSRSPRPRKKDAR